jgi:hypothetical protein
MAMGSLVTPVRPTSSPVPSPCPILSRVVWSPSLFPRRVVKDGRRLDTEIHSWRLLIFPMSRAESRRPRVATITKPGALDILHIPRKPVTYPRTKAVYQLPRAPRAPSYLAQHNCFLNTVDCGAVVDVAEGRLPRIAYLACWAAAAPCSSFIGVDIFHPGPAVTDSVRHYIFIPQSWAGDTASLF